MPLYVQQRSFGARFEGQPTGGLAARLGMQVIMDFYTWAVVSGAGYNVRHGTITTPEVGDVVITDAKAEMAVAAASGLTVLPIAANISFRLAAGTLFESAGKSVAASTMTGGTAFVPLPLRTAGPDGGTASAALASAMVGSAGGVTVAAELATTTRRHFSWSQPIAAGAWDTWYDWRPTAPPVLAGPACFYLQIAGTGTGPSYYASFDFLEFDSTDLI